MLRFNNHLVCSIHSRYPFCVHSSLSQSLCSLMLRSSTPSFAQFAQLSCSMANASFRSSGKICGCQIMIPLPLTFLTHFAIAKSGSPRTKSPPPLLSTAGVTSAHDFALPHATAFAPLASARASSLRKEKTRRFAPQFFLCSVPAQGCITCSQQFYHFLKLFYQIQIGAQETLKQSWVPQPDPILSHSFPVVHSILPNAVYSTLLNVVQFTLPNTVQSTLPDAILHT